MHLGRSSVGPLVWHRLDVPPGSVPGTGVILLDLSVLPRTVLLLNLSVLPHTVLLLHLNVLPRTVLL